MLHEYLPMLPTVHWLRPEWLLAAIPALLVFILLLRKKKSSNRWLHVIDAELLTALLDKNSASHQSRWPQYLLLIAWLLCALALAGPALDKSAHSALKEMDALVVLLDLSPSMLAEDVKPSRIQAAHYKLLDLLRERREGFTALIVYSGSAHVVTPLSDDTNTIAALVNTLDPRIMPSSGSQVEDAVTLAIQLLHNANFQRGRLLLITDGVSANALSNIHQQLQNTAFDLNVIGIGTAEGAPIPLPRGGFATDSQGGIVVNPLEPNTLKQLAAENGGSYSALQANDSDIVALTKPLSSLPNSKEQRQVERPVDSWRDLGYWLVLPCLIITLYFFRRGVVACLLPLALLIHQQDANAALPSTWKDWWQTPDQQAAAALQAGDAATAAKQFTDSQWKAYAEYQNGQHKEAAENFSTNHDANSLYNRGNAQAKAGDLQGAIDSYDAALKQKPDMQDAIFNRDLVKKLLDEKKQQQNDKQQDQQQQDQQQQDQQQQQQQQQQDQQQQDQQQQDQQQQDQQQQNQQQQDQQQQDQQQQDQQQQDQQQQDQQQQNQQQQDQQQQDQQQQNQQQQDQQQQDQQQQDQQQQDQQTQEQQKAAEQWLRKVPDDPGGLLRNKFDYYYQLNQQDASQRRRSRQNSPEEERW